MTLREILDSPRLGVLGTSRTMAPLWRPLGALWLVIPARSFQLSRSSLERRWHGSRTASSTPNFQRPHCRNPSTQLSIASDDEDREENDAGTQTFTVSEGPGLRLDRWLSEMIPEKSRSYLSSLCADGSVTRLERSGRVALTKKSHKVTAGESY